jgi:hypothetical protein
MRRLLKPSIAVLTFLVGLTAFFLLSWPDPGPVSLPVAEPIRISVCDLEEPSGRFVNQRVEVTATVYEISDPRRLVLYPAEYVCKYAPVDNSVFTELDLEDYAGPDSNLMNLFETERRGFEIDLKITGTIRKLPLSDRNHLFFYSLEPDNIEIISPWRKFEPKGAA